jgi:hypothetical protein
LAAKAASITAGQKKGRSILLSPKAWVGRVAAAATLAMRAFVTRGSSSRRGEAANAVQDP